MFQCLQEANSSKRKTVVILRLAAFKELIDFPKTVNQTLLMRAFCV